MYGTPSLTLRGDEKKRREEMRKRDESREKEGWMKERTVRGVTELQR